MTPNIETTLLMLLILILLLYLLLFTFVHHPSVPFARPLQRCLGMESSRPPAGLGMGGDCFFLLQLICKAMYINIIYIYLYNYKYILI